MKKVEIKKCLEKLAKLNNLSKTEIDNGLQIWTSKYGTEYFMTNTGFILNTDENRKRYNKPVSNPLLIKRS